MMTTYKQLPLFGMPPITHEKKYTKTYWYYIVRNRNQEMMYGADSDGRPMFTEHDVRPGVGIIPHLFNKKRVAEKYRDKHVKSGTVRRWIYSVHGAR